MTWVWCVQFGNVLKLNGLHKLDLEKIEQLLLLQ